MGGFELNRNRDFKGIWIPKEIYLDQELNWTEKILLMEIDSLDNKDGCYAKNKYFADFLGKSEGYISQCISKLTKLGYIYESNFDGRKRTLRSNLFYGIKQSNQVGYNNSYRQGIEIVTGSLSEKLKAQDEENGNTSSRTGQKTASINTLIKLLNKTEEEEGIDAKKFFEKVSFKFSQIFRQDLSVELFIKLLELSSSSEVLMKAIDLAEENADQPSYILRILQDWERQKLTNVKDIEKYIEKRKASSKPGAYVSDQSISVDEMEANGWK